jgi:hypothetical protein
VTHPLGIEHSDARYHVMKRGGRALKIFTHQSDYHAFLDLFQEAAKR